MYDFNAGVVHVQGGRNGRRMPITYDAVKALSAQLYDWSLRRVPADTLAGLEARAGDRDA